MTVRIDLYQQLGLPRTTATSEIDKRLARWIRDQLSAGKGGESLRSLETTRKILGNDERRRLYDMRLDNEDPGPLDAEALFALADMQVPSDFQELATPGEGQRASNQPQGRGREPQPADPSDAQSIEQSESTSTGQRDSQAEHTSSEQSPIAGNSVSARAQQLAAEQRSATQRYESEQRMRQPQPSTSQSYSPQQRWSQPPTQGFGWNQAPQPHTDSQGWQASSGQQARPFQQSDLSSIWSQPTVQQPDQVLNPPAANTGVYPAVGYGQPAVAHAEGKDHQASHRPLVVPVLMVVYLIASIAVRFLTVVEWKDNGSVHALRSIGVVSTETGWGKDDHTVSFLLLVAVTVLVVVAGMSLYALRRYKAGIGLWIAGVVIDFGVGLLQALKASDWAAGTLSNLGFGPYVLMVVALLGLVLAIGSILFPATKTPHSSGTPQMGGGVAVQLPAA